MNDQPNTFGPAGWTPDHYRGNGMQPFDVVNAFNLDFYEGNALKYLLRWRKKNGVEDLCKARTYVQILIDRAGQATGLRPERVDSAHFVGDQAPTVDEDVVRTARLESLGVLLSRVRNGTTLSTDESKLLVAHIDTEVRENTTARAVAAGNKRHVQVMYTELQETQRERGQAEAERNGAYRERAHLVALLAALTPGAVLAPAPDVDEPGWTIAYLNIGGHQASWHISPRDAGLVAHIEPVDADDPRAQWDGHTTDQKYEHIAQYTAALAAAQQPATQEG